MSIKSLVLSICIAAPMIAGVAAANTTESNPSVNYRSAQWAMIPAGEHIGETFALTVLSGNDSDTLDYGLTAEDCAAELAEYSRNVANIFDCRAERSI